jgi:hypothetical protein
MEQSVNYVGFPLSEETRLLALSHYLDISVNGDRFDVYDPMTQFRQDGVLSGDLENVVKRAIRVSDKAFGK